MESKQLTPLIILALIIGLSGSLYLYNSTKNQLNAAILDQQTIQTELSQITQNYNQLTTEIQSLRDINDGFKTRILELEAELAIPLPPPVVVETTEIRLDIVDDGEVRNIILLIGDGMGVGQITAAEFENGAESLTVSSFPYKSLVTTYSESAYVTDSAASATALATGFKTNNGRVSMKTSGEPLPTVLESAESLGKSTGIVSNTRVTHATPACFVAHVSSRSMEDEIAVQLLNSGVDVALGGGSSYFDSLDPVSNGYQVVSTRDELMDIDSGRVLGLFTSGYMSYDSHRDPDIEPSLAEMTRSSIDLLDDDPDGFFLMVEGGRIDHASHDNDFEATMSEVYAFDDAVFEALSYAAGRNDTLVLVTADHETGGLMVVGGYDYTGTSVKWITDDHTGSMVPVYGYGPRSVMVLGFNDNTDIGRFLIEVVEQ